MKSNSFASVWVSTALKVLIPVFLLCTSAWAGVTHQKVFVQQKTSIVGNADSFSAQAVAANDAIIVGVMCNNSGSSTPSNVTLTGPGWSFTRLGTINGGSYWTALFGAIAPNTSVAQFTVAWTSATSCSSFSELGDEFAGNDITGGTTTFDSTVQGSAACSLNLATGNADDAVWGACWAANGVTAVGSGYTQGANDGSGNWSEYENTTDGAGTWEPVNLSFANGGIAAAAVSIKPAPLGGSSPTITTLGPGVGYPGAAIAINGTNLGSSQGTSTVTFNGTGATVNSWSPTNIMVTVPAGATTGNVVVTVGGVPSNPVRFMVLTGIAHIKSFVQQSRSATSLSDTFTAAASQPNNAVVIMVQCVNGGKSASDVALTAPGWTGNNAFQLLDSIATSGDSAIAVFGAIAPNTTSTTFTVTWTASTSCSLLREIGDEFAGADVTGGTTTFDCTGPCAVGSNNAYSGSGGCSISVGTGSTNEAVWAACAPSSSVTSLSPGYSPGGNDGVAQTEYKLTTDTAGVTETANFISSASFNAVGATIKPPSVAIPPTILQLTPNSGTVESSVTITGTGFGTAQGSSTVSFGGTVGSPSQWSDTSITVPIPSAAISGNVVVTVGGQASNAVFFAVSPTVTGLSPSTGAVGTSITITGTGFGAVQGGSSVTFNGTTAVATSWNSTSITTTVPAGATTGAVIVTVNSIESLGITFVVPGTGGSSSGLTSASISVGYADSSSPSMNFPTPWQGSPNVVFIGDGTPMNAGAIRIDNPTGGPMKVDSVAVDLQRPTAQFNLWGSFTIPAEGSAILTQTQPGNFDTSAFPIVACGGTLASGETRIPLITVTIAGTPQTFQDTMHILDTGGFDRSCRGNESLQWRTIGTVGITSPTGVLMLNTPSGGTQGAPLLMSAIVADAASGPLANVAVNFQVLRGPNAGKTGQGISDNQGDVRFMYSGSVPGTDVIQASVVNSTGGVLQSNQVTFTWQLQSCGPSSPSPGSPSVLYIGATTGNFNDSIELAALLTSASGAPLSSEPITFTMGTQSLSATTDTTGVARVTTTVTGTPGSVPVNVSFAGGGTLPPLQTAGTVNVLQDETLIRYTGSTLLGNSIAQPVSAVLLDPEDMTPIANKKITFTVGAVSVSATTNNSGVASTTISLGNTAPTGPSSITISFAGDQFYQPSIRSIPAIIYFPAGFVVWGGNSGGLKIGQQVNFWGSQWENQVTSGAYAKGQPAFKGWSGSLTPIQQCQVNATLKTLTTACWQVKPGQSSPPNEVLPTYIDVVVSTVINKANPTVFGNIACGAVVQVNHTPPYGAVPGQPGFGTIVALDGPCGSVFPTPAALSATQTQPATVLPNQQITISTTISNSSSATAATGTTLSETLAGLTPSSESLNLGTIAANSNLPTSFTATVPAIPIRQSWETGTQYIQRLSALNGSLVTASGTITFSDAQQQIYLPVNVLSQSVLKIPVLTLSLTGPAVVTPGSPVTYFVTATNIGSAPAASVTINVTTPDGNTSVFPGRGSPAVTIVPGSSFSQPLTFTPAAISPIQPGETTAQYLARLAAADGQMLQTNADVTWTDAAGNAYSDVGQQIFSSTVRLPILNLTPPPAANLLPSQNATLNFGINNSGGCAAATSSLQVTNPDSSTAKAPSFPLAAGQSTTATTTWRVTAVAPHLSPETDSAYQTRLSGLNNSALNFSDSLSWTDPASVSYGPTTGTFHLTEVLPIVTVALTAPATAQAGNTITYTVTATNIGGANSPAVNLTVTLPDGSVQKPAVPALAPAGSFQTTINFAIPATQSAGTISAQAVVFWNDTGGNGYGSLSSTAQTTVSNPTSFNSLVLAPAIAGPDVTGTTQTLTATLKDPSANPIANATVTFTVTGANPTSGNATTNSSGVATFSYSGTASGNDTVKATSGTAVSNNATVGWVTPVQAISTNTAFARFFTSDNSGSFDTPPTATPVFTQEFPTINFNPPAGTIPGNTSNVDIFSRPFTNVTTDLNGNFTGTIVAQGNGFQAGVNNMFAFQAVFTSVFTVASAGNMVLSFYSDDGFILGVGGGATRVSGPMLNVPASGLSPFESLPVMGAFNTGTPPVANTIVINFPAAGNYPYELDYTECCGGPLVLTMTVGQPNNTNKGVPPTGSLALSPTNPAPLPAGQTQTFTVQASDASGNPVANAPVALTITGANPQQLTATTGSTGKATFSYSAANAGTDSLQAAGDISGLGALSNIVTVNWTVPTGGGTVFTPQGWIGAPLIGTVVQGQISITVASGISLTSGTLEYWPTANPSAVQVLNSNTTGSGTIGTLDATTLASGGYTFQLQATASNGTQQTSQVTLTVAGTNKPGRVTFTATDFKVPLAGMPISIARTYDSLNRGKLGDFGFGWSLATTVDLQVDSSNNVSFTINGQRRTFFFQAVPISFFTPYLLIPQYFPEPGLHGSLTSDGCSALMELQGHLTCFAISIVPYQPTTYTYTDPIGRVFVIAATGQLQSIKDLNGNVLTFGPNGITSSVASGVTVPFVRDTQGRITQISDLSSPANNYVYQYDGSGNLASVTLPGVANPEQYTYDSTHLIQTETDPLGNSTQTQYYPDGRIQSITNHIDANTPVTTSFQYTVNADGTSTTTTTFPDGGKQVRSDNTFGNPIMIVDPLGRQTQFTYFPDQSVKTKTDALGKITQYTYDANGFQTSVTDALLHTSQKTYNQFGGVVTSIDALRSNTTTTTYDSNFNPTSWTDLQSQTPFRQATYDSQGNIKSLTDGNGNTTNFQYDSRGNRTEIDAPLNQTTKLTYDAMDRVSIVIDARQKQTTFKYDALGRLSHSIDQDNGDTQSQYDGNNNLTSVTDALNRPPTTYQYDGLNHLIKITYPDQTTRQFTNDFRGNKLTETDQLGHVTKYAYDLAGQLTSATYAFGTPDQATVLYTYDADGRKKTETDGRGNLSTYNYDDAGRLTGVVDALGKPTTYGYDADNRRTSVLDANQHITHYGYDLRGRLQTITYNDLTTTQHSYDNNGNQLTITDQAGKITTKNYDVLNRLSSVADAMLPVGQVTTYTYDGDNNLTSVKDANNHITTFAYDDLNRRNLRQLPITTISESSIYDAVGNLSSRTDFNGKKTTYSYDSMNRLLSKTPDPTLNEAAVSFTYTATGKRATMTDASGTTTYHYDNRDRLISKITPQGTLSYTYDGANNVLSITSSNTNGASLSYSYDADDRLSTAVDNGLQAQGGAGVTSYGYDPGGNLTAYIYSNTVQTSYSYDTLNRLTSTQSSCGTAASGCATPGSPMASFVYTLDAAGNRTNVVELNGRSVTYGYDNDYRLTSEMISKDVSQNGSIAYTYDAGGNRTQITSSVPAIPSSGTLTYDANDRSTTDPYDNNGNLLNSGTGTNTWEFENRLIQDGNVSIIYDGDGNRVSETASGVTTKYLVDTMNPTGYAQVVDELVNGSVSRTYAYGLQRISENQLIGGVWTPSFYGYDGHGSVRFLTNSSALVTDTYEYDAFGNLLNHTGSTPNNYLFAGEQFDPALNVYQMRARWYRQATGRFISRDPVEGVLCCSLSWNPYIYVKQNPVNAVDPTGRDAIIDYAIELGESEESIAALRLTRVLVRTELFEECLVEQIIELREFGWPLLAAIAEAHIYCNALYPPIL